MGFTGPGGPIKSKLSEALGEPKIVESIFVELNELWEQGYFGK